MRMKQNVLQLVQYPKTRPSFKSRIQVCFQFNLGFLPVPCQKSFKANLILITLSFLKQALAKGNAPLWPRNPHEIWLHMQREHDDFLLPL